MVFTMKWESAQLTILDQTALPSAVQYITCTDYKRVCTAIRRLEVRGAPAIGAAAAYGLVLGAKTIAADNFVDFIAALRLVKDELASTRPTAVNLFWALEKMWQVVENNSTIEKCLLALEQEAEKIFAEDILANKKMGEYGASLITKPINILTHCNAGALATCGWGTALGVIRTAHLQNKVKMVYADETRPLLQGSRLTSWELSADKIPVTLLMDNMAGWAMKLGKIDMVIVGADRITSCGDTANKIGTYSVAVLAKRHNIPFYIAAPLSTFDFTLHCGDEIPIEERHADEMKYIQSVQTAPLDINVFNPAFDVTPHELITGIITEHGIIKNPNAENIAQFRKQLDE